MTLQYFNIIALWQWL